MQKITPCLWFDGNAEEAVNFYVSTFSNARVTDVSRFGKEASEASGQPEGTVMVMNFEVEGETIMALNGGGRFQFSPAISLLVNCESQKEVDHLWDRLSDGGETMQCGWLTDRFGVTWQIVPSKLSELMSDPDPEKSKAVMHAMLQMTRLDINELQRAHDQA